MPFTPPPGWPPVPPGWTPPPGWRPDPAWGPPPPGWQLWTPDAPPAPPRRRSPLPWVGGGLVLVLVLVGGAFGYTAYVHRDECGSSCYRGGQVTAPAALGTAQRVGDLTVTATAVDLTAAAGLATSAAADGRVASSPFLGEQTVITFEVTNEGSTSRTLLSSFFPYVVGTDGKAFQLDGCSATLPDSIRRSTLQPGASATGTSCLEVDPADLQGATVVLRDGQLGAGVSWTTGG